MSADGERTKGTDQDASLPITDVDRSDVNAAEAEKVKGGTGGAIEVTDYGFGISMPVTTSRSDGGGATVGKAK